MTPTEAVRAACDAELGAEWGCPWPECACRLGKDMLTTLIAAAEKRGAERERARWMECALKSRRPGHETEHGGWSITGLNKLRVAAEEARTRTQETANAE